MNVRQAGKEIEVWDPLVRVFHWTLVISFIVAYVSGDELSTVHIWSGYLIAGLLVFRLFWGFVGPRHARFSDFVCPPREIGAYLKSLPGGRPKRYLGHNPAGGLMVVLLLVSLGFTTGTGILMIQLPVTPASQGTSLADPGYSGEYDEEEHDDFEGNEALEEVHEFFANLTLLLVVLHVLGVVVSSRLHHENLVRAMITGRKPAARE